MTLKPGFRYKRTILISIHNGYFEVKNQVLNEVFKISDGQIQFLDFYIFYIFTSFKASETTVSIFSLCKYMAIVGITPPNLYNNIMYKRFVK